MKIEVTKIEDGRYVATVSYPWGQRVRCTAGTINQAVSLVAADIAQKETAQVVPVPTEK